MASNLDAGAHRVTVVPPTWLTSVPQVAAPPGPCASTKKKRQGGAKPSPACGPGLGLVAESSAGSSEALIVVDSSDNEPQVTLPGSASHGSSGKKRAKNMADSFATTGAVKSGNSGSNPDNPRPPDNRLQKSSDDFDGAADDEDDDFISPIHFPRKIQKR